MFIPRVEPLPVESQYDVAFQELSQEIKNDGGLRTQLATRALMVAIDPVLETQDRAVARYGVHFADRSLSVDDEASYDACYAYINGYMTTNRVVDAVFTSPHTFEDRLSSLDQWFQKERKGLAGTADDILDGERRILEQFGAFGMREIGEGAMGVLRDWSYEVYPDRERLARAFCFGAGAVITCGITHQHSVNYWASIQAEVPEQFDDELQKILNNGEM